MENVFPGIRVNLHGCSTLDSQFRKELLPYSFSFGVGKAIIVNYGVYTGYKSIVEISYPVRR